MKLAALRRETQALEAELGANKAAVLRLEEDVRRAQVNQVWPRISPPSSYNYCPTLLCQAGDRSNARKVPKEKEESSASSCNDMA